MFRFLSTIHAVHPFAIINSHGKQIEKLFRDFAGKVNRKLFPSFRRFDHPVLDEMRLDASTPLELLEEIRMQYGDYIDQETLQQIIDSNLTVLDAWAVSKLNESLQKQRDAMIAAGMPEDRVNERVPLIPKTDAVALNSIAPASRRQQLLQNQAYADYFRDVEQIINNGIIQGKSAEDITKEILAKVDMNAKRARFWAEDQAAMFQAEQKRIHAVRNGYTHYRWKAGASARPSHAVHGNQICSWNVGVNNLTRPGARHPGEDYRCHCTAGELLKADEAALLGYQSEPPRQPASTAELITNYEGKYTKFPNPVLADEIMKTSYSSWASSVTAQEASGLRAYKQTGYEAVNDGLRSGEIFPSYSNEAKYIQGIDSAMEKGFVPENVTAYRGVSDEFADSLMNMNVNDIFNDPAYTSTSFSEEKAIASAKGQTVLVVKIPKGYNAVYMESLISNSVSDEYELLLKRNARFIIRKKYSMNGLNHIEVEAL